MSAPQTYPENFPCDIEAGRIRGSDEPEMVTPVKRSPVYQQLLEQDC